MEPWHYALGYLVFGLIAIGLLIGVFVLAEWVFWKTTGRNPSGLSMHIIESIKGIVYDAVG